MDSRDFARYFLVASTALTAGGIVLMFVFAIQIQNWESDQDVGFAEIQKLQSWRDVGADLILGGIAGAVIALGLLQQQMRPTRAANAPPPTPPPDDLPKLREVQAVRVPATRPPLKR